ncbi:ABC transporter [Caloranaerobacter azorensis H53214]|uniref:ABC transporter n=1 Tax=Caloranaerobacter azorensis H53214 TaxID=1156417 RepID=A0A096CVM4_9FIRM|nr:ABC transporter ATP-binding protein [Caloranaerobacter azorensis]KGG80579.1 ABC transporter [Caloranaerobacter azorensis H53214]
MKRIWKYINKYKGYYLIAILSMMIAMALDMFNPRLTKIIIDDVIVGGTIEILWKLLLALIGITLSRAILGYIKEYLFDIASSKIVKEIRKDLFDHIQTLSFSYFDGMNTGEILSRLSEDVDNVWHALGFGSMLFIEQMIYFIVATIMLFTLNWKIALLSLATMPLIAYLAVILEKQIGEVYEKISDQGALLNTTAQENVAGVRLVKAFARERYEIEKFLNQNKENYRLNVKQADIWAKYHPIIEFLSNAISILIITVGGLLVIKEDISIGTLVAANFYTSMLIWPMRMLGWLTNILGQCNASLKKIDKIFNEKPTIKNAENPITPKFVKGHIKFENVSLEYDGVKVLKNINIDAKPGSTIAIMGTTGSGKSSLVNLIPRFYDCTGGRILLDGIDIKDIDLNFLRNQISVVMQDVFLFSDTIEENIKFGVKDTENVDIVRVAKDAQVYDFVIKMKDGFNTIIGERGVGLSGGQKQRISIARALAKESKILILDDATSALDMETEYKIERAIENRNEITKFIIAHRISAVKNADEIIILENGEIVERGTHDELLKKKGKYYDTYFEQTKGLYTENKEVV